MKRLYFLLLLPYLWGCTAEQPQPEPAQPEVISADTPPPDENKAAIAEMERRAPRPASKDDPGFCKECEMRVSLCAIGQCLRCGGETNYCSWTLCRECAKKECRCINCGSPLSD